MEFPDPRPGIAPLRVAEVAPVRAARWGRGANIRVHGSRNRE